MKIAPVPFVLSHTQDHLGSSSDINQRGLDMYFDVVPYASAGPLRFDMAEDEVTAILGKPSKRFANWRKEIVLDYSNLDLMVGIGAGMNKLDYFGFGPKADLRYAGTHVFADPLALKTLIMADGHPYECVGFIFLFNLGISLTGFHNDEPKAVSVFKHGYNDSLRRKCESFDYNQWAADHERNKGSV